MFAVRRQTTTIVEIGGFCALAALCAAGTVHAQGNVVMGFDAHMAMNSAEAGPVMGSNPSWGGFGRFSYGGMTVATHAPLGEYGAIEIRKQGADGSGMGFNFSVLTPNNPIDLGITIDPVTSAMFPLLDRSGYGVNFDPAQYVAELVFKPLAGNNGDQLNLTLDTFDGFDSAGLRRGEQWQWNFFDLANPDPVNDLDITGPDADGFYTVRNSGVGTPANSLSEANAGFTGPSYMFEIAPLPAGQIGDVDPDFNDFEAGGPSGGVLAVPNGARQIHLQTPYDNVSTDDFFAVKSLRLVKINPDQQEVARLDGHSGFSNRFGSPFRRDFSDPPINIGGTNYQPTEGDFFANTDQVSRFDQNGFTNIVIKSDDADEVGGLALWQPASSQVFDGTNATVDVTARLTVPQGTGQADRIVLVLKDKDGNDTAAGQGGDEYHYDLMLNQFNTTSMATVSVLLSSFTVQTAGEFVNAGDGLRTNFNLYYLGLETVTGTGAGLVNMEIESIRVMLPAPPGLPGDYNGDGKVDAADYVVWRKTDGTQPGYDTWRANFGSMLGSGSGSSLGSGAVPEPATCALGLIALGILATIRRRAR